MKREKEITLDTVIRRIENIDASDLNGEKVMMNLEKGQYFALNEVGSSIWDIIKVPLTIRGITEALLKEYDVDTLTCEQAVIRFIGKMSDAELINIS
jgi:hypothetical protein